MCFPFRQRTPFRLTLTETFLTSSWSPLCSCSEIIFGPTESRTHDEYNAFFTWQYPRRPQVTWISANKQSDFNFIGHLATWMSKINLFRQFNPQVKWRFLCQDRKTCSHINWKNQVKGALCSFGKENSNFQTILMRLRYKLRYIDFFQSSSQRRIRSPDHRLYLADPATILASNKVKQHEILLSFKYSHRDTVCLFISLFKQSMMIFLFWFTFLPHNYMVHR